MKLARLMCVSMMVAVCGPSLAHDLNVGDALLTSYREGEIYETQDLKVMILGAEPYSIDKYVVVLTDKATGRSASTFIWMEGGRIPSFVEMRERDWCDVMTIMVTLRYVNPPLGGLPGTWSLTHVFRRDDLSFIGTAWAGFDDIAAVEDGADLGFDYIQPQKTHVRCTPGAAQPMEFYEVKP